MYKHQRSRVCGRDLQHSAHALVLKIEGVFQYLNRALGSEDLVKLGLADPGTSPDNAIYGLALGRFIVQGKRFVYMTDWHGNLCTLLPK